MPLAIEAASTKKTANELLRDAIIASFSFLSALSIREFLVAATKLVAPPGTHEQLVFLLFLALTIVFITIVLAVVW